LGKKKIFYLDPDERKWTMEDLGLSWDDLANTKTERKMIEGTFFANNGKIIDWSEMSDHCPECLERLAYNEEYDSVYCIPCDEWQDIPCEDPTCEYCADRPEKPSDCAK